MEWHKTVSANEENMEDIGKWIGISGQHSEYQYGDDDDHDLPIGFEMALELHRKGVNIGDMPVRLAIDVPKGGFVLLKDFSVELVDISWYDFVYAFILSVYDLQKLFAIYYLNSMYHRTNAVKDSAYLLDKYCIQRIPILPYILSEIACFCRWW